MTQDKVIVKLAELLAESVEMGSTAQRLADTTAKERDKWRDTACSTSAELDKLRQARASERAQPMPRELLVEARNALVRAGYGTDEARILGRLDHAIEQTARPGDSLKVEHYETGKVTEYHRATPAEREAGDKTPLAFREAVREALGLDRFGIDSAVVAIHKLKADLEMRDGDVDDLRLRVRHLEKDLEEAKAEAASHREDAELVRTTVRHLESQAASYRDTISELRLSPKVRGALEQAFDDAAGPDRAGPPTARSTSEGANRGGM